MNHVNDNISRTETEKNMWNEGLDRSKVDPVLGYMSGGRSGKRLQNRVRSILSDYVGKDILELGSTTWDAWIDLENSPPKKLVCINISETELEKGIKSAKAKDSSRHCEHSFEVMDAHRLGFDNESFDVVFGLGLLHHLDLEVAVKEIHRVLKDDGKLIFLEPQAGNILGKIFRRFTPNARTPDEAPLGKKEMKLISSFFVLDNSYYEYITVPVSIVSKVIFSSPNNFLMNLSDRLDCWLEKRFGRTRLMSRYRKVLICGRKRISNI